MKTELARGFLLFFHNVVRLLTGRDRRMAWAWHSISLHSACLPALQLVINCTYLLVAARLLLTM